MSKKGAKLKQSSIKLVHPCPAEASTVYRQHWMNERTDQQIIPVPRIYDQVLMLLIVSTVTVCSLTSFIGSPCIIFVMVNISSSSTNVNAVLSTKSCFFPFCFFNLFEHTNVIMWHTVTLCTAWKRKYFVRGQEKVINSNANSLEKMCRTIQTT